MGGGGGGGGSPRTLPGPKRLCIHRGAVLAISIVSCLPVGGLRARHAINIHLLLAQPCQLLRRTIIAAVVIIRGW
jgi:hypothetical protein